MWGLAAGAAVHLAGCRCGSGGGASGEVVGWALPGAGHQRDFLPANSLFSHCI